MLPVWFILAMLLCALLIWPQSALCEATGWLGTGWWLSSTEDDIIEAIVLACVDFLAVACSLFVNRNCLVFVSECGASASEISFND